MGLDDIWQAITGMFGGVGGGTAAQPVQPINPNTAPGQPPSLGTPGGPVGGSGVGGTPPPTGTAPAVSISASGQPTAQTQLPTSINIPGMGNVAMPKQTAFDNPWLQAALSAYFAGAGSPRSRGMGGALAEAGKAGIGAYQQARAQQWTPYKTLAELQHAGAETQMAQATARKTDLEAEGLAGIQEANQATMTTVMTAVKDMPEGLEKNSIIAAATAAGKNKHNVVSTDEIYKGAQDIVTMESTKATTKKTEAETVTEQQRPQEIAAQTAEHYANIATQATTQDKNKADTALTQLKTSQAPQELLNETTKTAADWAKATDPTEKAARKAALITAIQKETSYWSMLDSNDSKAAYIDKRLKELGVTDDAPLMPGAHAARLPTYKGTNTPVPGWRHDPNDPTGKTVLDPDGIPHQVQ